MSLSFDRCAAAIETSALSFWNEKRIDAPEAISLQLVSAHGAPLSLIAINRDALSWRATEILIGINGFVAWLTRRE